MSLLVTKSAGVVPKLALLYLAFPSFVLTGAPSTAGLDFADVRRVADPLTVEALEDHGGRNAGAFLYLEGRILKRYRF